MSDKPPISKALLSPHSWNKLCELPLPELMQEILALNKEEIEALHTIKVGTLPWVLYLAINRPDHFDDLQALLMPLECDAIDIYQMETTGHENLAYVLIQYNYFVFETDRRALFTRCISEKPLDQKVMAKLASRAAGTGHLEALSILLQHGLNINDYPQIRISAELRADVSPNSDYLKQFDAVVLRHMLHQERTSEKPRLVL